jgi:UDP-N-acetylmuramate dehydrogenase
MTFSDITLDLKSSAPHLRGRLLPNQSLAELTWFRVGGPAEVLFMPEDEADLAYFLSTLPAEIPVTVVGLGSNLIVRDGGVAGVVVRLGRGFSDVVVDGTRIRSGAAVPDVKVARAAQEAGLAGLAFLRGIPGAIGGALRMNGGAYKGETKDVLVQARAVDRHGRIHTLTNADMHYSYRHCGAPEDFIFTQATFAAVPGDRAAIAAEMDKITESREATQPIKSRTARRCGGASRTARASSWNGRSSASACRLERRRGRSLRAVCAFPQPREPVIDRTGQSDSAGRLLSHFCHGLQLAVRFDTRRIHLWLPAG